MRMHPILNTVWKEAQLTMKVQGRMKMDMPMQMFRFQQTA